MILESAQNIQVLNKKFIDLYGRSEKEIMYFFSPGRINLIGEHIDYNGGMVIPAAISRGIIGVARLSGQNEIRVASETYSGVFSFAADQLPNYDPDRRWANYPFGVAYQLNQAGYTLLGCDILFSSDLPEGSGLSSSAAMEVLTAYILTQFGESEISRTELAVLCQRAENEYVGVQCGIMDQFAVAWGKKDKAILLDTINLNFEHIPVELSDYQIMIMNTHSPRKLDGSEYNSRCDECRRSLEILKRKREIEHLVDAEEAWIETDLEDYVLRKRSRHVVTENRRVNQSVNALRKGNVLRFGQLMNESHYSLRDDYEVTGRYLDAITDAARNVEGCVGTRMTGAGFGGCAIAVVHRSTVDWFVRKVTQKYVDETGIHCEIFPAELVDGVGRL